MNGNKAKALRKEAAKHGLDYRKLKKAYKSLSRTDKGVHRQSKLVSLKAV